MSTITNTQKYIEFILRNRRHLEALHADTLPSFIDYTEIDWVTFEDEIITLSNSTYGLRTLHRNIHRKASWLYDPRDAIKHWDAFRVYLEYLRQNVTRLHQIDTSKLHELEEPLDISALAYDEPLVLDYFHIHGSDLYDRLYDWFPWLLFPISRQVFGVPSVNSNRLEELLDETFRIAFYTPPSDPSDPLPIYQSILVPERQGYQLEDYLSTDRYVHARISEWNHNPAIWERIWEERIDELQIKERARKRGEKLARAWRRKQEAVGRPLTDLEILRLEEEVDQEIEIFGDSDSEEEL